MGIQLQQNKLQESTMFNKLKQFWGMKEKEDKKKLMAHQVKPNRDKRGLDKKKLAEKPNNDKKGLDKKK